ncbi:hypothetical protein HEK616_37140 [Streptomyces nigrescens]|uniref:Uncharacterized protein n=1 Tax=Streptomyces nigrescens TaxID=1920 RepID=A0ABM7ZV28_STRNI|nr:hypothetical protein HEK616_37140 [Streptomyces nigrescens]
MRPSALTLRTSPEVLTAALPQLSQAGLLTYTYDGDSDAPYATTTQLPGGASRPACRATLSSPSSASQGSLLWR